MSRYMPRLIFVLLLGAIINIAVAWACAIWSDRSAAVELGINPFMPGEFSIGTQWRQDIYPPSDRKWLRENNQQDDQMSCGYREGFGLDRRVYALKTSGWAPPPFTIHPQAVQT